MKAILSSDLAIPHALQILCQIRLMPFTRTENRYCDKLRMSLHYEKRFDVHVLQHQPPNRGQIIAECAEGKCCNFSTTKNT